jgi:Protein of unknown function (DUF3551)
MKTLLIGPLLIAGFATAIIAFSLPAQAQNYPWCAHYGNGFGGAMNCGFTTFEQCLETVRGIGGFCEKNDWYHPPTGPHRPQRARD